MDFKVKTMAELKCGEDEMKRRVEVLKRLLGLLMSKFNRGGVN